MPSLYLDLELTLVVARRLALKRSVKSEPEHPLARRDMQGGTQASRKWNRMWRQSPVGLPREVQGPAVAWSVVTGQVLTRELWVSESSC